MALKSLKAVANMVAAVAALIAAVLWYRASVVIVRPQESQDRDGWESAQLIVEHEKTGPFDPFLTNIEQSRLNKWAAAAASVAALLQGIVLLIPDN